ncbi:MAG: helix-turn-helix transcriptional regulator [Bdellovibrionota bacterium]
MKENEESLGKRLKRLREARNLSVKDVADAMGIPVTTYREWENDRKIVGEPYPALAELFEVSVYELITGEKGKGSEVLSSFETIKIELEKIRAHIFSRE